MEREGEDPVSSRNARSRAWHPRNLQREESSEVAVTFWELEGVKITIVPEVLLGRRDASSISWVSKFQGDKTSACKLSDWWSWGYREVKVLLSAGKRVVTKLQGDKSASQSELYDPWISGPHRVSCFVIDCGMLGVVEGGGGGGEEKSKKKKGEKAMHLEAQQRYFSYRAILVAIVLQNYFLLVFVGVSHNYRATRFKMGYRTDVPSTKKSTRGVSHHFGSCWPPWKSIAR